MDDSVVLGKKGYSLSNTLGEGSYGKVKSAYSDRLKCNVAVKIIDKRKTPRDFLERFLPREIQALRRLHHPSIIKTHEIFETSAGKVYIVMELGEKGDLLDYIKITGAMKEDIAHIKFQQLASAIKYCHDSDFAHRDLKCENILLDEDLNIKLSDFGFSKSLSRDKNGRTILSQTFCGSAAYTAPEVLEGIPYDPRISDIWSLGVILYTIVYALMPFDDSNVRKMISIQKQRKIPFPNSNHLTAECKDLIYHLLQPNASQRWCIDEVLKHSWLQTPKSTILPLCQLQKRMSIPKTYVKESLRTSSKPHPILQKGKEGRRKQDPPKDGWV
ncbi:LOW QUALITY PROTEIN: testis-specific serine/threonine-protein kinase 2 [Tyto alba]|uniref:LOW QUALITY PROTEIN: testis-specific serine/threonine-protein kinase 2 n=1 Tax=Tyto alba TaxID=56313 RepID=UPI001C67948F|nr:LOW QUALITY PROTEIN: testis-specific serine/threonine-protein kinase 2 [Tyto alba]